MEENFEEKNVTITFDVGWNVFWAVIITVIFTSIGAYEAIKVIWGQ